MFVKLLIGGGFLLRLFVQKFQETAGQDLIQALEQGTVLHGFAGNVQGQILAIHHALQKAQPIGEQSLGFRLDHDLLAIKVHFRIEAGHAEGFKIPLGHKEQRLDRQRRVGGEMQPVERL